MSLGGWIARGGSAAIVVAIVLSALSPPALAIVVSDDPALHVVSPPSEYDMVGYLSSAGGCTGVLVDSWFFLTASHAIGSVTDKTFTLHLAGGPQVYSLGEKFVHASADLALVRLAASTELPGHELYEGLLESGQEGILLGYGMSGTGETVQEGGDPAYPRGTNRIGYNKIDQIHLEQGVYELQMDFDAPTTHGPGGTLGADKEAAIALGDSGGPTFIDVGGTLLVAGIHVRVEDDGDNKWPDYGDFFFDIRVKSYVDWIRSNIPSQPAPETGDFNMDEVVDDQDIDALFAQINAPGTDLWYDVTGDGFVDQDDADDVVGRILGRQYGDADLDGAVDGADYTTWADHYKMSGLGWAQGDFNGDTAANGADYTLWADNFEGGAGGGSRLLPEPATLLLMAMAAPVLLGPRRRARGNSR